MIGLNSFETKLRNDLEKAEEEYLFLVSRNIYKI